MYNMQIIMDIDDLNKMNIHTVHIQGGQRLHSLASVIKTI